MLGYPDYYFSMDRNGAFSSLLSSGTTSYGLGINNFGIDFNGINNYLHRTTAAGYPVTNIFWKNEFSINLWIKPDDSYSDIVFNSFVSGQTGYTKYDLCYIISALTLSGNITPMVRAMKNGDTTNTLIGTGPFTFPFSTSNYYMLTLTFNNGELKAYFNSILIAEDTDIVNLNSNDDAGIYIGKGSSSYYDGIMQDLYWVEDVLDQQQIATLWNNGDGIYNPFKNPYECLKSYIPLNKLPLTDHKGNATIVNNGGTLSTGNINNNCVLITSSSYISLSGIKSDYFSIGFWLYYSGSGYLRIFSTAGQSYYGSMNRSNLYCFIIDGSVSKQILVYFNSGNGNLRSIVADLPISGSGWFYFSLIRNNYNKMFTLYLNCVFAGATNSTFDFGDFEMEFGRSFNNTSYYYSTNLKIEELVISDDDIGSKMFEYYYNGGNYKKPMFRKNYNRMLN